jgi:ribosome biogenesis protein MAK21
LQPSDADISFLDRFVYKNPKQKKSDHGGSVMQPKIASSRLNEMPVNSAAFLAQKEESVREDEKFFYKCVCLPAIAPCD